MVVERKNESDCSVRIADGTLSGFVYLGLVIDKNGGSKKDGKSCGARKKS